jgi:hypothetical protein
MILFVFVLLLSVPVAFAQEQDGLQVNPTHILQELNQLLEQTRQDPVGASRQRYINDQLYALSTQEKRLQAWWEQTLQSLNQARVEAAGNRRQLGEAARHYKAAKQHYRNEQEKIARTRQGFAAMQAEARRSLDVGFPELTIVQPETLSSADTTADNQLDRTELDALLTELEADFYRSKRESSSPVAEQSAGKESEGR